jgi:hypothetical protein
MRPEMFFAGTKMNAVLRQSKAGFELFNHVIEAHLTSLLGFSGYSDDA